MICFICIITRLRWLYLSEKMLSTMFSAPSKMAPVILKSEEMKLKVEWEPPVPANGPIEGYMVTVSGDHDDSEVPLYR